MLPRVLGVEHIASIAVGVSAMHAAANSANKLKGCREE